MDIASILLVSTCSTHLKARNRDKVIEELAGLIKLSPAATNISLEEIIQGLKEREKLGSTGLGDNIAIPHCKLKKLNRFVMAMGISKKGIAFNAIDNRSVHIFCVIVGPEGDASGHLKLLASTSRVLSNRKARYEILKSKTREALLETFLYHSSIKEKGKEQEVQKSKLLFIVVQEDKIYSQIMELFLEMGISGAVTHEVELMEYSLTSVPLFAGFLDVLGRSKTNPKTIAVLVPEQILENLLSSIEEITGDLDTHRGACVMVLNPEIVRGNLESI